MEWIKFIWVYVKNSKALWSVSKSIGCWPIWLHVKNNKVRFRIFTVIWSVYKLIRYWLVQVQAPSRPTYVFMSESEELIMSKKQMSYLQNKKKKRRKMQLIRIYFAIVWFFFIALASIRSHKFDESLNQ